MDLLKDLNEQQKQAVLHIKGPLLVTAGAGAGKTKVITHRVAYLIKKGVKPEQILAVTFTNKAAGEMKERIHNLAKVQLLRQPTVGTFHSICARILRENAKSMDLPHNFSILDKDGSLKLIKTALKNLNLNPKQFQPPKMQSLISRYKADLIKLSSFEKETGSHFFLKTLSNVWKEYEKQLKDQGALDFDDLIAKTVYLFQEKPGI